MITHLRITSTDYITFTNSVKNKNGQDSWIKVGLNFHMKSSLLWLDIFRRKVKSKVVTCLLFLIIDQWSITARGFSIPIHQFAPEWTRWSISRFWVCLFPKQLGVLGAFVYISDLLGIILTFVSCVFSIFIASCQHLSINWLQFHNTRHHTEGIPHISHFFYTVKFFGE